MIEFEIPGECRGKMRPRASMFAGHARVYTPNKQIEYENWVRQCYVSQVKDEPFTKEARIIVYMEVYMGIPKSFSKKKRKDALDGLIRPTKKPDVDNCIKSVLDSLNGIAYPDDAQVVAVTCEKKYAEEPKVFVRMMLGGDQYD